MSKTRRIKALRTERDYALFSAKFTRAHFPELTDAIRDCITRAWLAHRALMIELRA